MLFNSYEYLVFLPVVFLIYYLLPKVNLRIFFLLSASYFFYISWNPIYILLIAFSTILDYTLARLIENQTKLKKRWFLLFLSLLGNLGILFYFKYYNFLCDNLSFLLSFIDPDLSFRQHSWLLPVGISFYTFQTLSYTIDVYKKKIEAEKNLFRFALYVSFFPQLVAGPVERFGNLNPQFKILQKFKYDNVSDGLKLILLGLFKKIVVADKLAFYVDTVYSSPEAYTGWPVHVATLFFVFQLFCDFSGYSDIAIGSARILGYNLMDNFKGPMFSQNIAEFWRRWHISLSTWIRDYLFNPLAIYFRHAGKLSLVYVILITFILFGLWHGANNTFILFGFLHALAMIYDAYSKKFRKKIRKIIAKPIYVCTSVFLTFSFWSLTCLIFRSKNIFEAGLLIKNAFSFSDGMSPFIFTGIVDQIEFQLSLALILVISCIHYIEYKYDIVQYIRNKHVVARWFLYLLLAISIPTLGTYGEYKQFIYFQF